VTRIRVPKGFTGRNAQMRRDLATSLRTRTHGLTRPTPSRRSGRPARSEAPGDHRIEQRRDELAQHPCHGCPDRESHARWAERWFKLDREATTLRRRIEQRTNTVARQFDRVCDVLSTLGYLDADTVTDRGSHLRRLFSDMDLLAAESLRAGLWDGLDAAELSAALSVLVFETRRPDDASAPRLPGGRVRETVAAMVRLWGELDALERDHRLDFLRQPDLGFAWAAHQWALGAELDDVLTVTDLAAGDFVRWVKQLLDLTGQVADAAGPGELRDTARDAVRRLRRGVVDYSGLSG
jgi:ATP-dependent RNA helicase HelY